MNEEAIQFFNEDTSYRIRGKRNLRRGISGFVHEKGHRLGQVNLIFCSDKFLRGYNKQYLGHDYFTDVIAFDLSERQEEISGDVFISIDRVKENAGTFNVTMQNELARVIIHGLLHLMGMKDDTTEGKQAMRKEEDRFISRLITV